MKDYCERCHLHSSPVSGLQSYTILSSVHPLSLPAQLLTTQLSPPFSLFVISHQPGPWQNTVTGSTHPIPSSTFTPSSRCSLLPLFNKRTQSPIFSHLRSLITMYLSLFLLPPNCALHPSLLLLVFVSSQFCPLQSNSCLMNGELIPEV